MFLFSIIDSSIGKDEIDLAFSPCSLNQLLNSLYCHSISLTNILIAFYSTRDMSKFHAFSISK